MADIDEQARQTLLDNDRGGYTIPTSGLYPFQWNWDSCFCALGWATFDEKRAWAEFESLYLHQWLDGMVPHIIFHEHVPTYFPGPEIWQVPLNIPTSGITQPPVAASKVRELYETVKDKEYAEKKIRQLLPKLYSFNHWFHLQRDPNNEGLVSIYHPWESGRDNSADWDAALNRVPVEDLVPYQRRDTNHVDADQRPTTLEYDRYMAIVQFLRGNLYDHHTLHERVPFRIADVGINAILLRANLDLLWLMEKFDYEDDQAVRETRGWISLQEEAFDKLWDEEDQAYYSYDYITGEPIRAIGSATFLPLYAGVVAPKRAEILVRRIEEWTDEVNYLMPSLNPVDSRFEAKRYWRGPVWAVVNSLIFKGLEETGHGHLADRVALDTASLIKKSGFWEYFDPVTGDGLGGDCFSWTASMWLAWARHYLPDLKKKQA